MVDFRGDMQTMGDDLTQRDDCAASSGTSLVVAGIAEKWWLQHLNVVDDGATQVPSLKLRGESLNLTRVGYTWLL